MLGTLFGKSDKRLMGVTQGFLFILGKIFRRVDNIEDADRKGNWNRIKDVIRPFVTCKEIGQYPKSEKWMEK
jgi:hypothetical protein